MKVIGSSLHPRNFPIGMDFTAKVPLGRKLGKLNDPYLNC